MLKDLGKRDIKHKTVEQLGTRRLHENIKQRRQKNQRIAKLYATLTTANT